VDFNQTSTGGHQHIIVALDYFTKWVEAMPTVKYYGKTDAFFVFNQIIASLESRVRLSLIMAVTFRMK
jgi:hypothetical protein